MRWRWVWNFKAALVYWIVLFVGLRPIYAFDSQQPVCWIDHLCR